MLIDATSLLSKEDNKDDIVSEPTCPLQASTVLTRIFTGFIITPTVLRLYIKNFYRSDGIWPMYAANRAQA